MMQDLILMPWRIGYYFILLYRLKEVDLKIQKIMLMPN